MNNKNQMIISFAQNNPKEYEYLTLSEIKPFEPLMEEEKVSEVARGVVPSTQTNTGFLVAYKRVKGNVDRIEKMKNGYVDQTWGERRRGFIARHLEQMNNEPAFNDDGSPTRRHLGLIAWAFSPYPKKLQKYLDNKNKKHNPKKKEIRDEQGLLVPEKYYRGYEGEELKKRIKEIGDRRKLYKEIIERAEKENRKLTKDEYQLIYGEFETDKDFKPITSQYTLEAIERGIVGTLEAKRDRASDYYGGEIPLDMLEHIYKKGMGAWSSGGHRGGVSAHEWGMARVNSFLVGGKTFFHPSADKKQAEQLPKKVYNAIKKKAVYDVKKGKIVRKNPSATLIYGRSMSNKDWYRPLDHYDYYYHSPKEFNVINTDTLLESVDNNIYEIVRIAHEKGLSTSSSCQGHFYDEKELKRKYKKAKKDEQQIRNSGLVLENVENGKQILWKQSDYKFPYTLSKFIEIMTEKPRGYLPIYLHQKHCEICKSLDNENIKHNFDDKTGLLEFIVEEDSPTQQKLQWKNITDVFQKHYQNPLKIQSVLFDKELFTINSAINFLKKKKLNYNKVDIPKNGKYLRFRQYPPENFEKNSFRTKQFGKKDGVLVIYAQPKGSEMIKKLRKNPITLPLDDGTSALDFELTDKESTLLNMISKVKLSMDTVVQEISKEAKELILDKIHAGETRSMDDKRIDISVNKAYDILHEYGSPVHAQTLIDVLRSTLPSGYSPTDPQVIERVNKFAEKLGKDTIIANGEVVIFKKDKDKLGSNFVMQISDDTDYIDVVKELLRIVKVIIGFRSVRQSFFTEKEISVFQTTLDLTSVQTNLEAIIKADALKTERKANVNNNKIYFNFPFLVFAKFLQLRMKRQIGGLNRLIRYFNAHYYNTFEEQKKVLLVSHAMYSPDVIKDQEAIDVYRPVSQDLISLATNLYLLVNTKTQKERLEQKSFVFGKQNEYSITFNPHRPFYLDFTNQYGMATIGTKIDGGFQKYTRIYFDEMLAELGSSDKQLALLCGSYATQSLWFEKFKATQYYKRIKEQKNNLFELPTMFGQKTLSETLERSTNKKALQDFLVNKEIFKYFSIAEKLAPTHNDGLYLTSRRIKQFKGNDVPIEIDTPSTDYDLIQMTTWDIGSKFKEVFYGGMASVRDLDVLKLPFARLKDLYNAMQLDDETEQSKGIKETTYYFAKSLADVDNFHKYGQRYGGNFRFTITKDKDLGYYPVMIKYTKYGDIFKNDTIVNAYKDIKEYTPDKDKYNVKKIKLFAFAKALQVNLENGNLTKANILEFLSSEESASPMLDDFLNKKIDVRVEDLEGGYYDEKITRNAIDFGGIESQKFKLIFDTNTKETKTRQVNSNKYLDYVNLNIYPDKLQDKKFLNTYKYVAYNEDGRRTRLRKLSVEKPESDYIFNYISKFGNMFSVMKPNNISNYGFQKNKVFQKLLTDAQFEDLREFESYCRSERNKEIEKSIYAERDSLNTEFLEQLASDKESCQRKFRILGQKQLSFFRQNDGLLNKKGQNAYRQISFTFSEQTRIKIEEDREKGGKFQEILRAKAFYSLAELTVQNALLPAFATMDFLGDPRMLYYVDLGDTMGQFVVFRRATVVKQDQKKQRDKNKVIYRVTNKPLLYLITKKKDIREDEELPIEKEDVDISLDTYYKTLDKEARKRESGEKIKDKIKKGEPIEFDPFVFRKNPSDEYTCGVLETLRKQAFFYPYMDSAYGNKKKDMLEVIKPKDLKSFYVSETGDPLKTGMKYYIVGGGIETKVEGFEPIDNKYGVIYEEIEDPNTPSGKKYVINDEIASKLTKKGALKSIDNIEHGVVLSITRLPEIVAKFDELGLYDLAFALRIMFMRNPEFKICDEQVTLGKAGTLEQIKEPKLRAKVSRKTAKIVATGTGKKGAMKRGKTIIKPIDLHGYYTDEKGKKIFFKPYEYQQIGIYFAFTLNFCCLIADDMGLGKTVQGMASLWLADQLHQKNPDKYPNPFPCMVICPAAIMTKWYEEWYKWYPEYNAQIVDSENLQKNRDKIDKAKVYIGSYKGMTAKSTLNFYLEKKPNFCIFDEAHRMKTITSLTATAGTIIQGIQLEGTVEEGQRQIRGTKIVRKVQRSQLTQARELPIDPKFGQLTQTEPVIRKKIAPYRLMLTGTPLENNISECYTILKFINPSKYMDFKDFEAYFTGKKATQSGVKLGKTGIQFLRAELQCVMIRRFKTQVLPKDFPSKTRIQEFVQMPRESQKAYDDVINLMPFRANQRKLQERTKEGAKWFLGSGTKRARPIGEASAIANQTVEDIKEGTIKMLASKAGMQSLNDMVRIIGEAKIQTVALFINKFFNDPEGKFVVDGQDLYETVEKRDNDELQLVVFIKHKKVSQAIFEFCLRNKISARIVDGTTKATRSQDIKDFMAKKYQVIIGSQAIREGINLFSANHMLFAELWWNPAKMEQAEDRIWRIGQKRNCYIFYAIATGTVDTDVYEKLEQKKSLVSALIGSEDVDQDKKDKNEALETFADYMAREYKDRQIDSAEFIKNYGNPLTQPKYIAELIGVPLKICLTDPQRAREYAKSRKIDKIFGAKTSARGLQASKIVREVIEQTILQKLGQVTDSDEFFDYGYLKAGKILQRFNEDTYGSWVLEDIEWFTKKTVDDNDIDLDTYSQPAYMIERFYDMEELKKSYLDFSRVNLDICTTFVMGFEEMYKYTIGERKIKTVDPKFVDLAELLDIMIKTVGTEGVSRKVKEIKAVENYLEKNDLEFTFEKGESGYTSSDLKRQLSTIRISGEKYPNLNGLLTAYQRIKIKPTKFQNLNEGVLKQYKNIMVVLIKRLKDKFFL